MATYLDWQSNLTVEQVFQQGESFSFPILYDGGLLYLACLTKEQGRMALMFRDEQESRCLTPAEYSLRTRISEYGGRPFWVHGNLVYFINDADQCLYCQSLDMPDQIAQVTAEVPGERLMYGDLVFLNDRYLMAVLERERAGTDNRHELCLIDLALQPVAPQTLVQGADFYANLVVDPRCWRIAWVQWDHPGMPWDTNELWVADFEASDHGVSITDQRRVEPGPGTSTCQLMFANNGKLFFSADSALGDDTADNDFWNIFVTDPQRAGEVSPVTGLELEFGYPHWQYGDARIAQLSHDYLITFGSSPLHDRIFLIHQDTLEVKPVNGVTGTMQNLSATGEGEAVWVQYSNQQGPSVIKFNQAGRIASELLSSPTPLSPSDRSDAEHIAYPARDGDMAYGFYYPPRNSRYQTNGPPPLLVMVHGGPTARAYGYFDMQKQFWTSRGFALFDVNHRGSSGYGRRYRDALYGHWGEKDITDIIDGIQCLITDGRADPDKICIRGKSAGGYAVLRALTAYPEVFRAGACYYGIGNLATLAETTHKFEKHYTDRLVGEEYDTERAREPRSRYYQRSPIHQMASVQSAMILFQGGQDRVVPPDLAREVVATLSTAGVRHYYVEYADEGHGFRQAANNIDAWTKELQFYREVLSA